MAKSKESKHVEKKVIRETVYTVKMSYYDDNTSSLKRVNDGFTAIELLGLTALLQKEIVDQLNSLMKPDFIERQVITP